MSQKGMAEFINFPNVSTLPGSLKAALCCAFRCRDFALLPKGQYLVVYNEVRNGTAAKARPLILSPGAIFNGSAVIAHSRVVFSLTPLLFLQLRSCVAALLLAVPLCCLLLRSCTLRCEDVAAAGAFAPDSVT